MRSGISFEVSDADRARLVSIIRSPSSAQKHVWRARIIVLSGDGVGTVSIMKATGVYAWVVNGRILYVNASYGPKDIRIEGTKTGLLAGKTWPGALHLKVECVNVVQ